MKTAEQVVRDVPLLAFSDHLTRARQILRDDVYRELYVHNGKRRLMGYIDITDVLRITDTKSNVTVEGFIKEAPVVSSGDSLARIAQVIGGAMTDSAVIVDAQGSVMGAVLLSDIFPTLITQHEIRGSVDDHMTRKVVTIGADAPIQKVYTLIVESGFTAFPVVRGRIPIGMISRRDLLRERHVLKSLKNQSRIKVESIMTTPAITVRPPDLLSTAATILVKNDISRMPVVEGKDIVGIIDRHDVLKGLVIT